MKILHLIPSFGSGGAERQLSIIAPALVESGIECHIGYCYEGQNLERVSKSSVNIHRIFLHNNHDPRLLLNIIRLIRTIKPDLVQTWMLQMDVMGGLAAILTHTPFILSERSSAYCYPKNWKNWLRTKIALKASSIIANSQGGIDYWQDLNLKVPIYLIRNCIIEFNQSENIFEYNDNNQRLIVYAGRLSKEKNVIILLKSMLEVLRISDNTIFILFGEGPLKKELERIININNMSSRIFLNGYTNELPVWLKQAEFMISISEFEGNPNVVLEAAAQQCPLVLSDISAHREIFDSSCATFVKHNSIDSIVKGIMFTLNKKNERYHKAVKAKEVIKEYTINITIEKYISVYRKVLLFLE